MPTRGGGASFCVVVLIGHFYWRSGMRERERGGGGNVISLRTGRIRRFRGEVARQVHRNCSAANVC